MTQKSYMPAKKAEQVAFSGQFYAVANEDPAAAGLTQPQVDAFGAVNSALQAAWTLSENPLTRTKITVHNRDLALADMRAMVSKLVSIVQGSDASDETKLALGLTIRDTTRTIRPRPDVAPQVTVRKITGRTIELELGHDGKRGKAPNAVGATVFVHVGQPPTSVEDWRYASATTRTRLTLPFPPSETGDTVWVCAQWRNGKDESGPASKAISVDLPAGGPLPGEMNEAPMKLPA